MLQAAFKNTAGSSLLVALLIAMTTAWMTSAAAQPSTPAAAEIDLLADSGAWKITPSSSAILSNGQMRLPRMADPNDPARLVLRPVRLTPAAAWSLVVRMAAVDPAAADAAIGVVLESPDGRAATVMLRPRERDLIVLRSHNGIWLPALMPFVAVPGWDGTATTAREMLISSNGSRLTVQIDGRPVAQAQLYDFELSAVGMRSTNSEATFDKLVLRETGRDARLARLSGLSRAPGSAQLLDDELAAAGLTDRASAAGRALLGSIGGLFGSITSNKSSTREASSPSPAEGGWGAGWSDSGSTFSRDTERKRLVLESRVADRSFWVRPTSPPPLPLAGVAVQAKLEAAQFGNAGSVSISLRDTRAGDLAPNEDPSRVHLTIAADGVSLWEYRRTDKQWQRLGLVTPDALGGIPRSGLLRLVHQGSSAWVFVDGRLVLHASGLAPLRPNEGGLAVHGPARMELSRFSISEI